MVFGLFKKKPERYLVYEITPDGEKEVVLETKKKPVKEQIIPQPECSYICVPVFDGEEGEPVWSFREKPDKTDELLKRLTEKLSEPKKRKPKGLIDEERLEEIKRFAEDVRSMAEVLESIRKSFGGGDTTSQVEFGKLEFSGKVPAIMHPALIQTYSSLLEDTARRVGKAFREELLGSETQIQPQAQETKKVKKKPAKQEKDAVEILKEVLGE